MGSAVLKGNDAAIFLAIEDHRFAQHDPAERLATNLRRIGGHVPVIA